MLSLIRKPKLETRDSIAETGRWIEARLGTKDGYRFALECPPTVLATCFGILSHEVLGTLDTLSDERRQALITALTAQQDEQGLFQDPLHGAEVKQTLRKFPPIYVDWQQTYFALHALDALGAEAPRPLSFFEPFQDPRLLDAWLGTLAFDDFWFISNYLMFILYFALVREGDQSPTAHRVLDWLDARQDPDTGFWGTKQGASLFNGMAGAFHVFGFYQYLGRPIRHEGVALRRTVEIQEPTGLWGERGGGPCEDLDAVDILAKLKPDSSADERAAEQALEKALPALRACRMAEGGYRWTSPQRGTKTRTVIYSGLSTLSVKNDAGDLWSVWFRPLAIALAEQRLGRKPVWNVKYRSLPLLGWHPRAPD